MTNSKLVIDLLYFRPKSKHKTSYYVYPKIYKFVTTKDFIDSLHGKHYVEVTTALPDQKPIKIHARINNISNYDDYDPEISTKFKPLQAQSIKPNKAKMSAWANFQRILAKQKKSNQTNTQTN